MRVAAWLCLCLSMPSSGCSLFRSPDSSLAGWYEGIEGGRIACVDLAADGTYTLWWDGEGGLAVIHRWRSGARASGAETVTLDHFEDASRTFVVMVDNDKALLVGTDSPLRLKRMAKRRQSKWPAYE